jgi:hypothetical protein
MSLSSSSVYSLYARSILTWGTVIWSHRYAHIGCRRACWPRNQSRGASTTGRATGSSDHIHSWSRYTHQVRLTVKTADMPGKAGGKRKPTLQSPSCCDLSSPSQWGSGSTSTTLCLPFHRGREHNRTSVGSTPCSSTELSGRLPLEDTVRTLFGARRLEHQKCAPLAHPPHVQGRPSPELSNPLTYTTMSLPSHVSSDLASSDSPVAWLSSPQTPYESCESLAATYNFRKTKI